MFLFKLFKRGRKAQVCDFLPLEKLRRAHFPEELISDTVRLLDVDVTVYFRDPLPPITTVTIAADGPLPVKAPGWEVESILDQPDGSGRFIQFIYICYGDKRCSGS